MRTFSAAVQTLLEYHEKQIFYLVELGARNSFPARNHCSLLRDITVGATPYTGGGSLSDPSRLVSVEYPRISSVVDRQAYMIKYADPEFLYRPDLEDGYTGAHIAVKLGFYNTTDTSLGTTSTPPGEPLLNPADILLAYSGKVDSVSYDIQPDESVILSIECASPMAKLDLKKSITTSKDYMNQISSSDTSFDQIFEGSKGFTLLWGKI